EDETYLWVLTRTPSKLAVMSIFLIQEAGGGDMMIPLAAGSVRTRLLRAAMAQGILRKPRQLRRRLQELGESHRADRPKDRPLPRRQRDHHPLVSAGDLTGQMGIRDLPLHLLGSMS